MSVHLTTVIGLGIVVALVIGLALLFFSSSARSNAQRRDELKSKHLSQQPWDSAGGRANR